MIFICRLQNLNNPYLGYDRSGEREIKWAMITFWNNIKIIHQSLNYSRSNSGNEAVGLPQVNLNEYDVHNQSVPSNESISIEHDTVNPSKLRQLNEEFSNLVKLFQPISDMNPNLINHNINRYSDKFSSNLKDTIEVQLLKFLPSQAFVVIGNFDYIKLLFGYNFRDNLKSDCTDLSMNLRFLNLLHYNIKHYQSRNDKLPKTARSNGNNRPRYENKTTHSATKSRMNQVIDSDKEDSKNLDDDESGIALIYEENSNSLEFCMPGYLIRITQIENVPPMRKRERCFSVLVFQRYIRRRRTFRKNKDQDPNERCYKIGRSMFPSANISDRHIIAQSMNNFIESHMNVDQDTFLKACMGSNERRKIIKSSFKAELEIEDKRNNALIQTVAHYREIKSVGRNKFGKKEEESDKYNGLQASDIKLQFDGDKEPESSKEIENSLESGDPRKQVYYESEYSSHYLEDSYAERVNKAREEGNVKLVRLNNSENYTYENYFENDSSISIPNDDVKSARLSAKNELRVSSKDKKTRSPNRYSNASENSGATSLDDFFGQVSRRSEVNSQSDVQNVSKPIFELFLE